ncbi:hypothetical protein HUW62_25860 [Myxococcus sp. AM011]|uniref:hypothetical protein n=1 Tax=Myxococcus sp. AM011 TaxID=2745200 RepID=UPI00159589F7|nr:hypothetical protein [Myxococcus sp. AM011]NVJ24658.1 hypothetical protein [Myxococcus sp. AM011]
MSFKTNDTGRAPRLVLESLDGGTPKEIPLGRTPDDSDAAPLSAAVLGDVMAVAAQFGRSSYSLYFIDTKKMRLVKTAKLALPPLTQDRLHSWHLPVVAAGPDRFGIAIGHADELVWLEYDPRGRERVAPRILTTSLATTIKPWVVWGGDRFFVLGDRTVEKRFRLTQVPELLAVSPDGTSLERLVSLDGFALTPETSQWVGSGRLIFEKGALFLAARTYARDSTTNRAKFQPFRASTGGAVDVRECPDIDEE